MVCVGYSVRGEGEGEEAGRKEKEKEGGREGKKREGERGEREEGRDILHNSEYFNLNHTCVRAMM